MLSDHCDCFVSIQTALKSPCCHRIYLTEILKDFACDTFFPDFDVNTFEIVEYVSWVLQCFPFLIFSVFYAAVKLQCCLNWCKREFSELPLLNICYIVSVRFCALVCWKWIVYFIVRHTFRLLCFTRAICCNDCGIHLLPLSCFISKEIQFVIYTGFLNLYYFISNFV